jgi:hypothetical protein
MRVYSQEVVSYEAWVNMNVQVGHFLKRCLPDRMPKAKPLVRESGCHGSGNTRQRRHQGRSNPALKLPHVRNVLTRYNQGVARVELSKINESYREFVFVDYAGRLPASGDFTKCAVQFGRDHRSRPYGCGREVRARAWGWKSGCVCRSYFLAGYSS